MFIVIAKLSQAAQESGTKGDDDSCPQNGNVTEHWIAMKKTAVHNCSGLRL